MVGRWVAPRSTRRGTGPSTTPTGVDRPPVLIHPVRARRPSSVGSLPLRLLGAIAAAVTVAGSRLGRAPVRRGTKGCGWAAVTGAALLSTPLHWSFMVDGELSSPLPFVADRDRLWSLRGLAYRGGAADCCCPATGGAAGDPAAILTKQNIALRPSCSWWPLGPFLIASSPARGADARSARHVAAFGRRSGRLSAVIVAAWTPGSRHGSRRGPLRDVPVPARRFARDPGAVLPSSPGTAWFDLGIAALLSGLLVLVLVWGHLLLGVRRRHRDVPRPGVARGGSASTSSPWRPAPATGCTTWCSPRSRSRPSPGSWPPGCSWALAFLVAWVPPAGVGWSELRVVAMGATGEGVWWGRPFAGRSRPPTTRSSPCPGRSNVDLAAGLRSPDPHLWARSRPARSIPAAPTLKELLAGTASADLGRRHSTSAPSARAGVAGGDDPAALPAGGPHLWQDGVPGPGRGTATAHTSPPVGRDEDVQVRVRDGLAPSSAGTVVTVDLQSRRRQQPLESRVSKGCRRACAATLPGQKSSHRACRPLKRRAQGHSRVRKPWNGPDKQRGVPATGEGENRPGALPPSALMAVG